MLSKLGAEKTLPQKKIQICLSWMVSMVGCKSILGFWNASPSPNAQAFKGAQASGKFPTQSLTTAL